ncbi:GDSL-like Lipase/Acylhydrolase [Ruminococcus sp. YRD2003]|uniref:GDSL-type esterase/lipase family protein n=1 Tax=Ruminococcus sp. YRD2003 TaxID=1452313 RepID=UPI0008D0F5B0|nr:GDSL-like Lipase/Acylhydrolase [Ruminococcus flavefaciens]
MGKKRVVQHKSKKKKDKPFIKFSAGMLIFLFLLSFTACFVLYMLAANFNSNFFADEFGTSEIVTEEASDTTESATDSTESEEVEDVPAPDGLTNPVPQSSAMSADYLGDCCLITDSTLIQMADFGSFNKDNIFGSTELTTANCGTTKVDSNFGNATVYDIVKNKKPNVVYIMLGSDLGTSSTDDMIASYTTLVNNLHGSLPTMEIYVMQIPPVIYDSDVKSNEKVNDFNKRLLAMCNTIGVHCIDTNTALKNESGALKEDYWSYDTLALSKEAYSAICEYILTHTA